MQSTRPVILFVTACTVVFGFLAIADPLFAVSKEKVLYDFCSASGCTDGFEPAAGLIFDTAGNLYGTTADGGANSIGCASSGCGTVFQLARRKDGEWAEKVLYNFCSASGCADGSEPVAGLILDTAGNLYGTTFAGGASGTACGGYGCGTVFQLTHRANGKWTERVLHSFDDDGKDGYTPVAGVIFDKIGNLYGTTTYGGTYGSACNSHGQGCGTVFQLTHRANGKWTESVLHSFHGKDGYTLIAGLIFDAAGKNLYGTTAFGGAYSYGAVFELIAGTDGKWTEKVLHSFCPPYCEDGNYPYAAVVFDSAGNLYGTTIEGGPYSYGTIFELTLGTNGKWKEKVLHAFGKGNDGSQPEASLMFDASRNLFYGTTAVGGAYGSDCNGHGQGCGTVFQLARGTSGKWAEKVLYSFDDNGKDGYTPVAGVTFDKAGNLYGTTLDGGTSVGCGSYGCGSVFKLIP